MYRWYVTKPRESIPKLTKLCEIYKMPQNIPKSMKYVFVLTKMQKNTKIITKCFGCINFDLIMQKVRKMRKTRLSA